MKYGSMLSLTLAVALMFAGASQAAYSPRGVTLHAVAPRVVNSMASATAYEDLGRRPFARRQ